MDWKVVHLTPNNDYYLARGGGATRKDLIYVFLYYLTLL